MKTGKSGAVYLARDRVFSQRCIYREYQGSGDVYRKLQDIQCTNLPKIYKVMERGGMVYVLEEYIQGDSLAFLLEAGPLSAEAAGEIILQLCSALKIMHSISAVHRDIKPENILIRGSEAVLIDFDASRLVKIEHPTDTRIMGTTGYAAPEQYGFSQTDARADIYSLGILLNEMLTRQHPSKCLAEGRLHPVIEKCIEVNVDKRYGTAEELAAAVREACSRKKRSVWKGAVVAAVIIGLGAAVLWGMNGREAPIPEETAEQTQQTEQAAVQTPELLEVPAETEGDPEERRLYGGRWQGSGMTEETYFRYDLDGDGDGEVYKFGIYHEQIPEGHRHALSDSFLPGDGETYQRNVYPCVWRCLDDGALEMAREFDELLSDAEITLWRGEGGEVPLSEVSALDGLWHGGLKVLYTNENKGEWIYEITAQLGDKLLYARAKSIVG